jgi:hypothetical protein
LSRASSSAADIFRYVVMCRDWGHTVAAHADALYRALPPHAQFLPQLVYMTQHKRHPKILNI